MKSIDFLEHGGGGFALRHHDTLVGMPDPRALHFQRVLEILYHHHVPGTPADIGLDDAELVFQRWCAAWDLPDFTQARRLAYLVDHYRSGIAYDLQTYANVDLGTLWRQRRWTMLLDLLDHLPAHSWYNATVSMDEEHANMVAEALLQSDEESEDSGPSLVGWSPEVSALTNILDAVNAVSYAIVAVNSEKGKTPKEPAPARRPVTPLERAIKRAQYNRRKAKHESLVARVLPHKAQSKS